MMYTIVYISLVGCLIGLTLLPATEAISWKNKPVDQSVAKGGTVTFQCEVNDRQEKPVIWNKGSTSLSSNSAVTREFQDRYSISGEFNLVIRNVQESDNDLFMCNVFDLGSAPAKLTVLLPPNPPVIQRNVTGNPYREKQVVAFTCESSGGNPNPTILWYKNGKEIVESTNTPSVTLGGASSSRIIVTLDSTDHQANYSCVVYNEANKNSPLSTFILLQVQYPPYLTFGPYNPYNVKIGENTKLECRVDSNPQVNTVTWLKNGQPYLKQNKLLTFNPIVKSDSGNYTCRATNGIGPSKEATAHLQAVYAPEITVPGSKTYRETEKIEIDCIIDSHPRPFLVQWEKIDANKSKIYYGSKLTINNAVREDAGNYTCKAWSELRVSGQRTQNVTGQGYTYIHIQYGPGEAFISPVSDVEVGKPLVIKCSAKPDGYPAATYKWEKDGVVLQQTTSTYRITTSRLQDNGIYKCTPVNLVSQGRSKQIQVNVNQIPTFISKPAIEITLPITHQQMLSITCKAKGRPPPVIHWYKDDGQKPITVTQSNYYDVENKDVTLETYSTEVTNTLYLRGSGRSVQDNKNTALRIEDMGQYHCWVNSSFYREPIKATQTLNLQFKPVVKTDEVRIAVNFSLPVQLPCVAQAFPVPKFQWYRKGVQIVGGPGRFSIGTTKIDGVSKYRSTLTINNVKTQDLGYYNCFASNNLGNVSQNIHLSTKTAPESPLNLHSTQQTWESAILVWEAGFDGGYPQHFILKVSTLGEERLVEVNPPSATTFNVTNLKPQTTYSFVVFGQNQLGRGNSSRQLILKTAELSIPSIGPSVEFNVQSRELTLENKIKDNYCLRVSVKRKNNAGKWDIAYQCFYFPDFVGNLQESNVVALNISVCLKDRPDVCGEPVTATLSEAGGATLTERDVYIIASVCGVIIITLLIILIIFICRRKKNQAKYQENKTDTERRTQPVNGVQQPKKQQVYENQDGPLDLKHNHGNGYLANGHATANGHVPHDTSYDSHVDKRMFENEMNRRNENVGRVDYNNRQGADIHFHGVPKSPSKDQYIDLEEKKEGSLQSNPESGYSTPDPSKPKKFFKLKHRQPNALLYSDFARYSHNPPGHTCGLPCCREDLQLELQKQFQTRPLGLSGCIPAPVKYSEPNFTLTTKRNLIKGRPTFANKFLSLQPSNLATNAKQRAALPDFHDDILVGSCYSSLVSKNKTHQVSAWDHFYRQEIALPQLLEDADHLVLLDHEVGGTLDDLDNNEIGVIEVHSANESKNKPLRLPIINKALTNQPNTIGTREPIDVPKTETSMDSPIDEGYAPGSLSDRLTDCETSDSDYITSSDHYYDVINPLPLPANYPANTQTPNPNYPPQIPKSCLKKNQNGYAPSPTLSNKFSTLPKHFYRSQGNSVQKKSAVPFCSMPLPNPPADTPNDQSPEIWTVPLPPYPEPPEQIYEDIASLTPFVNTDDVDEWPPIPISLFPHTIDEEVVSCPNTPAWKPSPVRKRSSSIDGNTISRTGTNTGNDKLRKKVSFVLERSFDQKMSGSIETFSYQTYPNNKQSVPTSDKQSRDIVTVSDANNISDNSNRKLSSTTDNRNVNANRPDGHKVKWENVPNSKLSNDISNLSSRQNKTRVQQDKSSNFTDMSLLVKSPVTLIL